MKKKTNSIPSEEEAKAIALEFYKKLEKKEAAKRHSTIHSPESNPSHLQPQPHTEKSSRKTTRSSFNNTVQEKSPKVSIEHATADLRARQYYDNYVIKLQSKKHQSHTPTPPNNAPKTKLTRPSPTSWYTSPPVVARSKSSRMIETLYNDMFQLEQMEADELELERPTFLTGLSSFNPLSSTTFGATSLQPKNKPFWTTSAGNTCGIPNSNAVKATTGCAPISHSYLKEHATQPMKTSQPSLLHPIPITKKSSSHSSTGTSVNPNPVYSNNYKADCTTNDDWLGRLFTILDVVIFVLLYMLEMKFHILSSFGLMCIRFTMHYSWKMIVKAYHHGFDAMSVPTTLILCIGCCIVVQYSVRPSTLLLHSFRMNRKIRYDQIQSDVGIILNMVYNELMKQDDVNVPIRTLQDMMFSQLFMDESMHSCAGHHLIAHHSTKDRTYWVHTVWPRVVELLLNRNPYVVVVRNTFTNDKETYLRWKPSSETCVDHNDPDSISTFKKRKAA